LHVAGVGSEVVVVDVFAAVIAYAVAVLTVVATTAITLCHATIHARHIPVNISTLWAITIGC
jgi:hypothetical protein